MNHHDVKEEICRVGKLIYDKGFVAANDGNISVKVAEDRVITTPTGVSKGMMTPEMMVTVNLDGEVIDGQLRPSSELKMHLRVYKERPDVQAVVHAHPPHATAFAIAGIPLDKAILPEAVVTLGTIPIAEYGTPGTEEIPDSVAKYVKDHNGLLLESHGALTWAKDLMAAYFLMESLEFTATISFYVKQLGAERQLSTSRVAELREIRERMGITGKTPDGLSSPDGRSIVDPKERR
ncbi:class II aldolase/adducin family protein [Fictibacillus sp. Mic-4]|uniref:class II aldolase/adducin family protein n=1 Tax=Fictibacillus sp. Mic-4 TaxID=3132826 RepID=UPI003CF8234D